MADVFISYSKKDIADARLLAAMLEAKGYSTWWDVSLVGGEQFREKIVSELGKARAVVVIWTKASVKSRWVQSEADRADREKKLIPVRSEIEYTDIPPPFDSLQTLKLDQREEILTAVAVQLAKPAATGPWLKAARYEVLTWLGVAGGAITLTTSVSGLIWLSNIASWLLSNWTALLKQVWRALLLNVEIAALDAELLTMAFLMTSAVLYSSFRPPLSAVSSSRWRLVLPLFFVWLLLIVGSVAAYEKDRKAPQRTEDQEIAEIERVYADDPNCAVIVKRRFGLRKDGPDPSIEEFEACVESSQSKRTYPHESSPFRAVEAVSNWISELSTSDVASQVLIDTAVYVLITTLAVLLPFVVYLMLSFVFPLKLQVPILSRRLWRTLAVFVGLVALNYVAIVIEVVKGWIAALPAFG
jgi:hypothetical protein